MVVASHVVMEKKEPKTQVASRRLCARQAVNGWSVRQRLARPRNGRPAFDPRLFLTKLVAGKTTQEYQAGECIFSQGDTEDAVFYIQSGKVKLTVVSTYGKEAVVAILPEGSFFGEGCLAGQPLHRATATAAQRAIIIRVTKQAMVGLLHQEPEFAECFVVYLISRNICMEEDRVDQLFNSSKNDLPGFFCCSRISARGPSRYRRS